MAKYYQKFKSAKIKYYCSKIKKTVVAEVNEHDFDFGEQDCECCGSHGELTVEVKCKCGLTHIIDMRSW